MSAAHPPPLYAGGSYSKTTAADSPPPPPLPNRKSKPSPAAAPPPPPPPLSPPPRFAPAPDPNNNNNNNSSSPFSPNSCVDDTYYRLLEVAVNASTHQIKINYYRLSKKCHPDKNSSPEAEEKFKQISEAYQVLCDPERRNLYNQFGRVGAASLALDGQFVDPRQLFRSLFGAGQFDDIFGIPLAETLILKDQHVSDDERKRIYQEAREKRIQDLTSKLTSFLESIIPTMGTRTLTEELTNKAFSLIDAPGGLDLCLLVGYVYSQEGTQHTQNFFGIPAFVSRVKEKTHIFKETLSTLSSAAKAAVLVREETSADITDEEAQILKSKVEKEELKVLWKLGKLDINMTLRKVCETCLEAPQQSEKHTRAMAKGLNFYGSILKRVSRTVAEKESGSSGPPQGFSF